MFEWGCGNSTIWWSRHVRRVVAVEDNAEWFNMVRERVPENVDLRFAQDHDAYVSALESAGERFDLIVVDGSHRTDCVDRLSQVAPTTARSSFSITRTHRSFLSAVQALKRAGWHRLDLYGMIACFAYKNCTSIYLKD